MSSENQQFENVNRRLDEMSRQQGAIFSFLVDLKNSVNKQMQELNKKQEEVLYKVSNQQQQMSNAQNKLDNDIRVLFSREDFTRDVCMEYQKTAYKQLSQIFDALNRLSYEVQSLPDHHERFQSKPIMPNQETQSVLKGDDTREFASIREINPSYYGQNLSDETVEEENSYVTTETESKRTPEEVDLDDNEDPGPRKDEKMTNETMVVLGGYESGVVESYSPANNIWTSHENISDEPIKETLAVTIGDVIVSIEVEDEITRSLDFASKRWTVLKSPPVYRNGMKAAVDGNLVYLTGGLEHEAGCHVYHFQSNQWSNGPNLNVRRIYHGSTTLNGKIYCCGGKGRKGKRIASTEVFDPRKEGKSKWTFVADMKVARAEFGLGSCSRFLWAVGGGGDLERYDPLYDNWTKMADMKVRRSGLSVCFFSEKLYAIGGYNNEDGYLDSVEAYDPERNEWIQVAPLNTYRFSHASCVVPLPSGS